MNTIPFYRIALLVAFPLALGLAGIAQAHPQGQPGANAQPYSMSAKIEACRQQYKAAKFANFDLDKDGKLSREERQAAHVSRKADSLAEYDNNHDGILDKEERQSARLDTMIEKFQTLDSNSDEEISLEEAAASCSPVAMHFSQLDVDGNQSINWAEFENAAKSHKKRGRRGMKGHRKGDCGNKRGHAKNRFETGPVQNQANTNL